MSKLNVNIIFFPPAVAYCCGLCVLSVSWALVLYSRACCLIRPGHLALPPAALLCQLVWRAGMLGARVTCLMFFARVFHWWVCGVAGNQSFYDQMNHSFSSVSDQTDLMFCVQVFTGLPPPSGWCHSNQISAPVPGVGAPSMASWDLSTSSSSSMSKMDLHATAWPAFTL